MDYEVKHYKIYYRFNEAQNWEEITEPNEENTVRKAKQLKAAGYLIKVEKVLKMIIDF